MASRGEQWLLEGVGGQGGAPTLWSLDQSLEYLREHFLGVIWRYSLAMLPYTLVILGLTQAVSTGRRADVRLLCVALTAATIWRWIGLAWMQRQIQIDIAGPRAVPFRTVLPSIVRARAMCNFAMTCGGLVVAMIYLGLAAAALLLPFLIIPATIGMYFSVLVTPIFLSGEMAPAQARLTPPTKPPVPGTAPLPPPTPVPTGRLVRTGPTLANAMGWMFKAKGRLWRISWILTLGTLVFSFLAMGFQLAISSSTLADWFGLDAAKARVVVESVGWNILLNYVLFVAFDIYFHIVGVFLFYDLQARRLGSDLFARLDALQQRKGAAR